MDEYALRVLCTLRRRRVISTAIRDVEAQWARLWRPWGLRLQVLLRARTDCAPREYWYNAASSPAAARLLGRVWTSTGGRRPATGCINHALASVCAVVLGCSPRQASGCCSSLPSWVNRAITPHAEGPANQRGTTTWAIGVCGLWTSGNASYVMLRLSSYGVQSQQ